MTEFDKSEYAETNREMLIQHQLDRIRQELAEVESRQPDTLLYTEDDIDRIIRHLAKNAKILEEIVQPLKNDSRVVFDYEYGNGKFSKRDGLAFVNLKDGVDYLKLFVTNNMRYEAKTPKEINWESVFENLDWHVNHAKQRLKQLQQEGTIDVSLKDFSDKSTWKKISDNIIEKPDADEGLDDANEDDPGKKQYIN